MYSTLLFTCASAAFLGKHEAFSRSMAKALALGVECEEMCKATGAYPQGCQCPGWNGQPASSNDSDGRDCYTKYCVPIAHTADPCPSDEFVTCVAQNSKVAALMQANVDWEARATQTKAVMTKMANRLAADVVALGAECEEMCKLTGSYPQGCKCPGWNGTPASSDAQDGRDCYTKYCKPIAHTEDPCPSDDFVTCVADSTSFVQMDCATLKAETLSAIKAMQK